MGKKTNYVIIFILSNTLLAILISAYVLREWGFDELEAVYIKVLETRNEMSAGNQVRICTIKDNTGRDLDLREIAELNNWDYDEDLQCLAYYGKGNQSIELPVSHTTFLYVSFLEQPSSGMLEIYCGENLYKNIDLYSNEWNVRNYMIHGRRNVSAIILVLASVYIISFLFLVDLTIIFYLLKEYKNALRKIVFCSLILFIKCEIMTVSLHLYLYPEKEYGFMEEEYNDYIITGFKMQDNELYSEINDPNVTVFFDQGKIPVKQASIHVEKLSSWREWAQAFLLNENYEGIEFFLQEGKNDIYFQGSANFLSKSVGLRLDLVSRPGVHVVVDSVTVNQHSAIVKRAVLQGMVIYCILMAGIIIFHVIRLGQMGITLALKRMAFFINPIITFISVEFLELNPLMLSMKIWFMEYSFILLCQVALYYFCNKKFFSVLFVNIFFLSLGVINYYVMIYRGMPLTIHDVFSATTAVNVISGYKFEISFRVLFSAFMSLGYVFVMQAMIIWFGKSNNKSQSRMLFQEPKNWLNRLCVGSICIFAVCFFVRVDFFGDIGSTMNIVEMYHQNGFILSFFTGNTRVEKPKGYSLKRVNEIMKGIEDKKEEKVIPNIIIIMNESFADLTDIMHYDTNIEVLPFLNNLNENVVKGHCHVSVFGGGTSNTEFEVLTGNSLAFLPRGSNPYTQYCNREIDSIVSYLKRRGYLCVAEHPNTATNYNRNNVYRYMGFDYFWDQSEFKDEDTLRFISDQATYDKIIELYEDTARREPFFVFDVTMQNHGGYGTESNWQDPVKILGEDFPEANEYLSSIHVSDQAFQNLIEYFAKEEEPTIILMFGDHQPSIGDGFVEYLTENSGQDELVTNYVTPFLIWANYEIETKLDVEISSNYLSYLLLDTAGIRQSLYTSFLEKVYQEFPVITVNNYMDKEGEWYEWGDQVDAERLLLEYQIVQYAHFYDRKYKGENQ